MNNKNKKIYKKTFEKMTYKELKNLNSKQLNQIADLYKIYPCELCDPYTDKELIYILRKKLNINKRKTHIKKSLKKKNRKKKTFRKKKVKGKTNINSPFKELEQYNNHVVEIYIDGIRDFLGLLKVEIIPPPSWPSSMANLPTKKYIILTISEETGHVITRSYDQNDYELIKHEHKPDYGPRIYLKTK